MALVCVNPPLVEPVSLTELKEMLRQDPGDTGQDVTLNSLSIAARVWCETLCRKKFVQQTWRLLVDYFPGYIDWKLAGQKVSMPFVSGSNAVLVGIRYAMVLPFPPVQSIVVFQYQDANGNVTAMNPATDFVQDLQGQPARLTPPFGRMWPVARVTVNAVQVDFTAGYATPITVSTNSTTALTSAFSFVAGNVGQAISIPGAGPAGGVLNTVVASVAGGAATLRDAAAATLTNVTALLVNYGNPGHWELIKTGIKFLVNAWYLQRTPNYDARTRDCVKAILGPARDLRM